MRVLLIVSLSRHVNNVSENRKKVLQYNETGIIRKERKKRRKLKQKNFCILQSKYMQPL
jgi:hypothetical protein